MWALAFLFSGLACLFVALGIHMVVKVAAGSYRDEHRVRDISLNIAAWVLALSLVIVATIFFGWATGRSGCSQRWYPANTHWSITGGCVVEVRDGVWLPQDRIKGQSDFNVNINGAPVPVPEEDAG